MIDREACLAAVHGIEKSWTWLSKLNWRANKIKKKKIRPKSYKIKILAYILGPRV